VKNRWPFKRRLSCALVLAPILAIAGLTVAAGPATARSQGLYSGSADQEQFTVTPNPANNLDCNGWSPKYQPVAPARRALCTDARGSEYGNGGAVLSTTVTMWAMTSRA
jgi:hypothetical protein